MNPVEILTSHSEPSPFKTPAFRPGLIALSNCVRQTNRVSADNTNTANHAKVILVNNLDARGLIELALGGCNHLVQKSQAETMRELRAALLIEKNPEIFFEYPLAVTLSGRKPSEEVERSLTLIEWQFSTLAEKEPIIEDVEKLFDQTRLNKSLRDDVSMAANELACNVLFNAPCEKGINTRNLQTTIGAAQTSLKVPAVMKIGAYRGFMALTCIDHYGSLLPERIFEKLKSCVTQGPGESINFEDRGTAGIGCYMVFNACTSFYMAVKGGRYTQFCALFPLAASAKERELKGKNLHWLKI